MNAITRRDFLKSSMVSVAAVAVVGAPASTEATVLNGRRPQIDGRAVVDTNVTLGRWPGRRLPLDETGALVKRLQRLGVTQAWVSTFDGLLHKDLDAANARLAEECRRHRREFLIPFGVINPAQPNWESVLAACRDRHRMPGIRLYPGYHDYKLEGQIFPAVLKAADEAGLLVQLAVSLEDERTQHARLRADTVDLQPLPDLLRVNPRVRIVLLNWRALKVPLLSELVGTGRVYFDIATVEGVAGLSILLERVPAKQVVFGSHAPFFYPESALLKLRESDLTPEQLRRISSANAEGLVRHG